MSAAWSAQATVKSGERHIPAAFRSDNNRTWWGAKLPGEEV